MATDEQWRLVEWDQDATSSCILELRGRVEALEANMNGIAWAFDQHAAKWQQDAESENLRQQDEDVERVANFKPTPNDLDLQIRSSAPAVGLVEMLADVWVEGKPLRPTARRAAIRKVAKWLEQQQEVPIGSTASADYFAAMLREEADQ